MWLACHIYVEALYYICEGFFPVPFIPVNFQRTHILGPQYLSSYLSLIIFTSWSISSFCVIFLKLLFHTIIRVFCVLMVLIKL